MYNILTWNVDLKSIELRNHQPVLIKTWRSMLLLPPYDMRPLRSSGTVIAWKSCHYFRCIFCSKLKCKSLSPFIVARLRAKPSGIFVEVFRISCFPRLTSYTCNLWHPSSGSHWVAILFHLSQTILWEIENERAERMLSVISFFWITPLCINS